MTDECPYTLVRMVSKVRKEMLGTSHLLGHAGRGNKFFFRVSLCAHGLESQGKPNLHYYVHHTNVEQLTWTGSLC